MMRRFVLIQCFAVLIAAAAAAQDGTAIFLDSVTLFGDSGAPPVVLDSSLGWVSIGSVSWDGLGEHSVDEGGPRRRWRLRSVYEHQRAGGPVALQLRIRDSAADAVFTHPWSESAARDAESYSNWYEEGSGPLGQRGASIVEARLIAPPRVPLTAILYTASLEAWNQVQSTEDGPGTDYAADVQLAYASPLAGRRSRQLQRTQGDSGPAEALGFALAFVESCLTGNLAVYYRSQANPLRSLDDGAALTRYRQDPPQAIPGLASLEDYKRRFDYRIYDSETFEELFPEWFDEERPWIPERQSYLFMGHRGRWGEPLPPEANYLVFLVGKNSEGEWKVIARPGN